MSFLDFWDYFLVSVINFWIFTLSLRQNAKSDKKNLIEWEPWRHSNILRNWRFSFDEIEEQKLSPYSKQLEKKPDVLG